MNKIKAILIVFGITVIIYLLMLIISPFLYDMAVVTNATASAAVNVSNFPGSLDFLLAIPWILWFVPGSLCVCATILILRH